jgi:dihydrodipicolinate synthase/N-acetylneuraminate lyase
MLLDGMHVPLTTPFYPDGRVYFRKLEHNADRYARTPAAGLMVAGAMGEPLSLSDEETAEVLAVAAAAAAPEKVLIAGVARESVREAVRMAERAAEAGYDAILLRTPGSFPGRMVRGGEASPELLGFYRGAADGSPLPVILDNAPAHTRFDLPVNAIAALAQHENILGLYEANEEPGRVAAVLAATASVKRTVTVTPVFAAVTGRMLRESAEPKAAGANFVTAESLGGGAALAVAPTPTLRTRTKTVGFQVIAGGSGDYFRALQEGATGVAPEFAACAPQASHEVLAAWKDGNVALAAEKFARIEAAAAEMGRRGVGAVKFGCDLNGYFGGRPRLPQLAPPGTEQAEIAALLQNIRN